MPDDKGQGTDPRASERGATTAAPALSLPKGGGAVKGIDEKFAVNPATGTASLSAPIFASPGRAGFGPQLALSYDSGAGNTHFGFGWSLAQPAITRKTDKGLPQYDDATESDVFLLSGAEDLVPALSRSGDDWVRDVSPPRTVFGRRYTIDRYCPRVEGLFARIERWTNVDDLSDVCWRSIAKDNITSWYGKTTESRIVDPDDATRIFSWLISESSDGKGNVILYRYKSEDSSGVDRSIASEQNRTDRSRSANAYLKRVLYGNRAPYLPDLTQAEPAPLPTDWCFELVFDYGEHTGGDPTPDDTVLPWNCRPDPFSTYRAGFEVRTYRLCTRALMFHHFPDQPAVGADCLVRSTNLEHANASEPLPASGEPFYSFLLSVNETGYRRNADGYVSRETPRLEFEYAQPIIDETVRDVDATSLQNAPYGLDDTRYRWVDLDGEGISGLLTEQGGSWYYKPNWSAANLHDEGDDRRAEVSFGPVTLVARQPSLAALEPRRQQLMDLSGDGQLDLVQFSPTPSGFFERTDDAAWSPFTTFESLPAIDWNNPNLKFIDLTGDGLADLLIAQDRAFWWHASLGADGFSEAQRVEQALDEEKGPRLVFADETESIFLADMSGDGLTDLVRIRLCEVCYWPNLGYGRFGAKVSMDNAPCFDRQELFNPRRIRLADIDGAGTADIIYLAGAAVHVYFNQSGNGWSSRRSLAAYPPTESVSSATAVDLLGNGTACLVWSSPLPGHARRPMRYIDLMGGVKPHLLVRSTNNLGAELHVSYASSTKFYLEDKLAGTPWLTRLPFPVHVVERVESYDYVSRNRFVTSYAYHHGFYDGVEREFRGFARVDQCDRQQIGALTATGEFPQGSNEDLAASVPPVLAKTWFHTGAFIGADNISRHLAEEYYQEGDESESVAGPSATELESMLLDDTVLPTTIFLTDGGRVPFSLGIDEMREACRALRGSILRQEVYGLDDTPASDRPYSVSERNYTIELLQPAGPNRHAVFFSHPRETIDFQYDRALFMVSGDVMVDPASPPAGASLAADPRVTHALTFAVDPFGNVLRSAAVAYGRRLIDPALTAADQTKQRTTLCTCSESGYTNAVLEADVYRTPLPAEASSYELFQVTPAAAASDVTPLFEFEDLRARTDAAGDGAHDIRFEDRNPTGLVDGEPYRRLLECTRVFYRPDDFGENAGDLHALLPLGTLQPLAITGCQYRLALTPGLLDAIFRRSGTPLLPSPASVLGAVGEDGGGYVDLDSDGHWWIPSGRMFYTPGDVTPPQEKTAAFEQFFMPRRFENPFGQSTSVDYDSPHGLLPTRTTDPLNNVVLAENDYRVLQPVELTNPNGNRFVASFDALGFVAGSAAMGKATEHLGDSLDDFEADLTEQQIDDFYNADDPHALATTLLGTATQRTVYDLTRFQRSREASPDDPSKWQPAYTCAIAREIHISDLAVDETSPLQLSFTYSDGFNREIQKKVQAEPGPIVSGGPTVTPRWLGSGWVIFNNKGKPVRKYEPFFSQRPTAGHQFEFGVTVGVSSILCYDPVERVIATIHPNHTYEKIVFDPWRQFLWDANDTVLVGDPTGDPDVGDFFRRLPPADYSPTWYAQREGGVLGADEQDAAAKAAVHAKTSNGTYFDSLGRAFKTVADNGTFGTYHTRVELDIVGTHLFVTDTPGRRIISYDYDLLATRIHQVSMEAGERWMLRDVLTKPIRGWDARGFTRRYTYDQLRRDLDLRVQAGTDDEAVVSRIVYGETVPNPEVLNLRGKVVQHFDEAGLANNLLCDFKGNILQSTWQFAERYDGVLNWATGEALTEEDPWSTETKYDALNRPVSVRTPDGTLLTPHYNDSNLLRSISVRLPGEAGPSDFVTDIEYDAKAQRQRITYGNGAATSYAYDPATFRLVQMLTMRGTDTLQDLRYTQDPVGNITRVVDAAQSTIYFKNQQVEPGADFVYDAVYRLIQATGREHIGLVTAPQTDWTDQFRTNLPQPNDGNAMQRYTEHYEYDDVGNFQHVIHSAVTGNWTRDYTYAEASLIDPAAINNRVTRTAVIGTNEPYTYDLHGNMTSMPHLSSIEWGWADEIQAITRQVVNAGPSEKIFYTYNAAGQRARKVIQRQNGTRASERLYLAGFEVYREYGSTGTDVTLERHTLHVRDDRERIALVERRVSGNDGSPPLLVRYQFNNQLGSALLELDEQSRVLTYEEYYPYGATSYQAADSTLSPLAKRYRFSSHERDEESGFYYFGSRYYAPWIGRWVSCDPEGLIDGVILYEYTRSNPIGFRDRNGRESGVTDHREINNLFKALSAVRAKVGDIEFARFVGKHDTLLFPILSPFGFKGSRSTLQGTLEDFDRAFGTWAKEYYSGPSGPAAGMPARVNEDRLARQQMWATAASDPIAAAVIGSGAIISATIGRLFGFEQDPRKAAAAGAGISHLATAAGSLNAPHPVNEMVRQGEVPQDRVKEVEGKNISREGPQYGSRPINTGPVTGAKPDTYEINCGHTTGALLEGRGGTSTSFAERSGVKEGFVKDLPALRRMFLNANVKIGTTLSPTTFTELVKMMKTFPAGTNFAVAYSYTRPDGTVGGHVVAGMVSNNKTVMFVESQNVPVGRVNGPTTGHDFHFFAVTPQQR